MADLSILDQNQTGVQTALDGIQSVPELEELLAAEEAGKNRKGVKEAIEDRLDMFRDSASAAGAGEGTDSAADTDTYVGPDVADLDAATDPASTWAGVDTEAAPESDLGSVETPSDGSGGGAGPSTSEVESEGAPEEDVPAVKGSSLPAHLAVGPDGNLHQVNQVWTT